MSSQKVRRVHLKRDEIALVKTAVGIATLIQVPDRPTSVVLGDANAFKVEYLENAITIKPLSHSSKSNLYIYTEGRRFNVSLVAVPLGSADYIVYLEPEITTQETPRERWRSYIVERSSHGVSFATTRAGKSADLLMLSFQVRAPKPLRIKPEWIWMTQNGRTVPIQDLELSGLEVSETSPVTGFLSVRVSDLPSTGPLVLEWRSQAPIKLRLPEAKTWTK